MIGKIIIDDSNSIGAMFGKRNRSILVIFMTLTNKLSINSQIFENGYFYICLLHLQSFVSSIDVRYIIFKFLTKFNSRSESFRNTKHIRCMIE